LVTLTLPRWRGNALPIRRNCSSDISTYTQYQTKTI
jgi:hypothetical protein